jgi:hypothetical protein
LYQNLTAKIMEQKKLQKQSQEQLPFSEQLRQRIINQPCDPTDLWGRAADSFPQNKRKQRIRTAIAVVVGVIIGALAMHFLSSPERWIRL